jgi:hypothetical protein
MGRYDSDAAMLTIMFLPQLAAMVGRVPGGASQSRTIANYHYSSAFVKKRYRHGGGSCYLVVRLKPAPYA